MARTPQCPRDSVHCRSASPWPGESLLHCFSIKAKRRILSEAELGVCKILKCVKHKCFGHVTMRRCFDAESRSKAPGTGRSIPGAVQGLSWCWQPRPGRETPTPACGAIFQGHSCQAVNRGWSFATGQGFTPHGKYTPNPSPPPCRKRSVEAGVHSRRRVCIQVSAARL